MRQILNVAGELLGEAPVSEDEAADLYRAMVFARLYDRKGTALQKQGRYATYAPYEGQEASQIGSASVLEPGDWMVATYRDPMAMWRHGYPLELLAAGRTGDERGGSPPAGVNVLPPSITVGGHMVHAVGLAWAERLRGTSRIALTYFGDGATSEGDFHEAMNFAGAFRVGCVFLCQNNGWAISMPREAQTASETIAAKADGYGMPGAVIDGNDVFAVYAATSEAVERARAGDGPTLIEAITYRMGPHSSADDPNRYREAEVVEDWRTRDPLERLRRYLLGLGRWNDEWQQQLEAEASEEIERAVAAAEAMPAFEPGEIFDAMFAELPGPLVEQRVGEGKLMPTVTLAQAINHSLDHALADMDDVLVMGEDVGRTGGVFRVTDGLLERYGADRVIDTPVAESGIAGVGLGLAVGGMRPVLEMQFMGFSYPAFDQVISHISRIRNRSRHRFTAPLVIRIPYGGGIGAAEHHSESAEAIYAHTPGLKVVVPSRPADAAGLLRTAIEDPDPVIFLEPIRLYRAVKEDMADAVVRTPLGVASVERAGDDVTLLAWGAMMKEARAAAERLEASGISVELVDLRSLVPLDVDTICGSVQRTGRAVVVHEAPRTAGFGAEVVAQIQERCLYDLEAPVLRVTGWDTVFPLKRAEHHYLPSVERIATAVEQVVSA